MDTYSILQLLAWIVVGTVMAVFAMTGGFDFGAGILLPFLGKKDEERRVVINTVGPTWDGNQVWLITAGGCLFALWPRVYAASFSGFYFAFLLVLWSLFFRPVAFEYRSKLPSQRWRSRWDIALFIGSLLPPLLIGVGIGNLFLGVPFEYNPISLRFFYGHGLTDTSAIMALFGLLRPFAILSGLICVCMMAMHGAGYVVWRTEGIIHTRAQKAQRILATVFIVLFSLAGIWVAYGINGFNFNGSVSHITQLNNSVSRGMGAWMQNYHAHPWMILAPVLALLGGLATLVFSIKNKYRLAFSSSALALFSVIFTMGFSLFPFIMPSSTAPQQSLLMWNATSSQYTLTSILVTVAIMLPIIGTYTVYVYKKMWKNNRKLSTQEITQQQHILY